jgi:tRNA(Ile)-lysidine synthase
VQDEVIPARVDAQPLVTWPGASVRRYRNGIYLLPEELADGIETAPLAHPLHSLGAGLGALRIEACKGPGLSPALVDAGLVVRPRSGGEEFQPQGQAHTRKLKKLLQEDGIVPWMRDRLPLLYSGGQLVAVGDLWLSADVVADPGRRVVWIGRPALH